MNRAYILLTTIILLQLSIVNSQAQPIEFDVGSLSGIEITGNYYDPSLRPEFNSYGKLGESSRKWSQVYGNYMYAYGFFSISDERSKENIKDLSSVSEKLKNIRVVKYDFKKAEFKKDEKGEVRPEIEEKRKDQIGFLAQNLMTEFPELVQHDQNEDTYSVNYNGMIPVLLKAIKEQQIEIENLKAQFNAK